MRTATALPVCARRVRRFLSGIGGARYRWAAFNLGRMLGRQGCQGAEEAYAEAEALERPRDGDGPADWDDGEQGLT
jgi:hypothetical protein